MVRYWNKFSMDMVESPPLEVLKRWLKFRLDDLEGLFHSVRYKDH